MLKIICVINNNNIRYFLFTDSYDPQIMVLPSLDPTVAETTTIEEAVNEKTAEVPSSSDSVKTEAPGTPAPMPARGDGPQNMPKVKDATCCFTG